QKERHMREVAAADRKGHGQSLAHEGSPLQADLGVCVWKMAPDAADYNPFPPLIQDEMDRRTGVRIARSERYMRLKQLFAVVIERIVALELSSRGVGDVHAAPFPPAARLQVLV